MKVKWSIGTGYVMRIPDWVIEIPDEDVEGLNEGELWEIIDEYVQDDFSQKCHLDWEIVEDE